MSRRHLSVVPVRQADPQSPVSSLEYDRGAHPLDGRENESDRRVHAVPPTRTALIAKVSADADIEGCVTDELMRAVGLLLGSCGSPTKLALLATELATHLERRDVQNVIEQLRWRLDLVSDLHSQAREQAARPAR